MKRLISIVVISTLIIVMLCNCASKHEHDLCIKDVSLMAQKGKLYLGMNKDDAVAILGENWRLDNQMDEIVSDSWPLSIPSYATGKLSLVFSNNNLLAIFYYLYVQDWQSDDIADVKDRLLSVCETTLGNYITEYQPEKDPSRTKYIWNIDNKMMVIMSFSDTHISISLGVCG